MADYIERLVDFLERLCRWSGQKFLTEIHEDRILVKCYTNGHEYRIVATSDYLGCTVSARKPRPGEDWTRGSDLADGDFSEETWNKILRDIIGYELLTISSYITDKPLEGQDETPKTIS